MFETFAYVMAMVFGELDEALEKSFKMLFCLCTHLNDLIEKNQTISCFFINSLLKETLKGSNYFPYLDSLFF
jgi:hypothetical protein